MSELFRWWPSGADDDTDPSLVRRALFRFATSIVVTLAVLAVGAFYVGDRIAREEALREARLGAAALADNLAAPLVDQAVRAHTPGASDQLTTLMNNRMRDGSVRHVKLWSRDGDVIWSDQKQIVGRHFDLPADVRELFETGGSFAEVSDLTRAENVAERGDGQLLEVYVASEDLEGNPFIFEAYLSTHRLKDDQKAIVTALFGLSIGVLLLFALAVLPLGVSLARGVERSRLARSKLTRHALHASDLERRRIAQILHDGVIQDLAGIGYLLPILRQRMLKGATNATDANSLARIGDLVTRDVAALRSMLTDIYPPDLARDGLAASVDELAQDLVAAGMRVDVSVPTELALPLDTARLAYRVAREAMHNVLKHSQAEQVAVRVVADEPDVVVSVTDDGVGLPDTYDGVGAAVDGHLGLRLLRDTIDDLGGRLVLSRGDEGGTRVEARFPLVLTTH
jgi:signal transduction histidine kinase